MTPFQQYLIAPPVSFHNIASGTRFAFLTVSRCWRLRTEALRGANVGGHRVDAMLLSICRRVLREARLSGSHSPRMAIVIEYYVPEKSRKQSGKWIPPEQCGKIIPFPAPEKKSARPPNHGALVRAHNGVLRAGAVSHPRISREVRVDSNRSNVMADELLRYTVTRQSNNREVRAEIWMRRCAACRRLLRKSKLCDQIRCECGWKW